MQLAWIHMLAPGNNCNTDGISATESFVLAETYSGKGTYKGNTVPFGRGHD